MEHPLEKRAVKLLPSLCMQAIDAAEGLEWGSFGIQTLFEKKFLAQEDAIFDDYKIEGCMALKNILNAKAAEFISKKTSKPLSRNPDVIFKLDFSKSRGTCESASVYIFGHYMKKTRQYCQHLWLCNVCKGRGCQKCDFKKEMYPSIEGSFRSVFIPAFEAKDAFLHAAGREDVDVMTYGSGRPFVIEIRNPKKRNLDLKEIDEKIKSSFPLEVVGLKFCPAFWIETVCTSHFDKHYRALVTCEGRSLTSADFELIKSKIPLTLRQQTPIRVMGRRSDLMRHRRVYSIKLHDIEAGKLMLDIWAEAGTYIKELIHGDNGRTNPSVSAILSSPCACAQLDVILIDDGFLKTIRGL